jgi:uncharacterized protein HemX
MIEQNINVNVGKKKVFFFLLIIVIMVAAIVGGYLGLDWLINKIDVSAVKIEATYAATKQLQIKYEQLQNSVQELQKEIQKSNIAKTRYWKPVVIEHLIHMADLTLNTTRDVKLALSFLVEAKRYANDPELSAINHALNKDIAVLQVVSTVDASQLVLKIEAISQKIGSLPMVVPQVIHSEKKEAIKENSQIVPFSLWQRFFTNTINALKDIVVIRRKTIDLLLSPDQESILRLEIQAKLLQAQLAVMQQKNKIYQSCLAQTYSLFTSYFSANQIVVVDILPLLQELQQVNLEPIIPFPTESIAAITNFIGANKVFDEKLVESPVSIASQNEEMPAL